MKTSSRHMRIESQYTRMENEMTMSEQRCKSAVVEGGEATEKDSKLVGSERKVFTCSKCGKSFSNSGSLYVHRYDQCNVEV